MNDNRDATLDAIATLVAAHSIGIDELVAHLSELPVGGPTVAAYITDKVLPSLSPGRRKVWAPYLKMLIEGYPGLCACTCVRCMDHFTSTSAWTPCPCTTAGRCNCPTSALARSHPAVSSCCTTFEGFGDKALAELEVSDLAVAQQWAHQRAEKRALARRAGRSQLGRPIQSHDGRGASEHLRNAASAVYRIAIVDRSLPSVQNNLALELEVPDRQEITARAFTPAQLEELWRAVFSSGSDPELDSLIIWTLLELGARSIGLVQMRIGDLLFASSTIRLTEKNGKVAEQPASRVLMTALLDHALRRGDIVVTCVDGLDPADVQALDVIEGRARLRTDASVLYYKPKISRTPDPDGRIVETITPRPFTKRRYEILFGRLKAELPWFDEFHGRPHDLRKTGATFIERAFGTAVAKSWLRHTVTDAVGTYTQAKPEEVRAAHAWWTGTEGPQPTSM